VTVVSAPVGGSVRVVRRTLASTAAAVVVAAGVPILVTLPWWVGQALLRDLIEFFTLLALAQMWNLLAGYAGLVSIGQQAFIGLGAYALYLLADRGDVHPFAAVALAGLAAAAISLITAVAAFRLRGGYFAIGTWVIAEAFRLLTLNGADLGVDVGGGVGAIISSAAQLDRATRFHGAYWWALGVGAGSVLLTYAILRSRVGLALTAIRDDEAAARSLGVNVLRTKVLVWVIAAFVCGLAGAVVYLNLVRVEPAAAFDVNWTAFMIFIVVIGGIGTIEGPIVGTVIFFVLQKELADYGVWYLIILGSVAVLIAIWLRGGIWHVVSSRLGIHLFPVRRRVRLPAPTAAAAGTAPSRP
jgi:branched-chain amino acid transport system permease protein